MTKYQTFRRNFKLNHSCARIVSATSPEKETQRRPLWANFTYPCAVYCAQHYSRQPYPKVSTCHCTVWFPCGVYVLVDVQIQSCGMRDDGWWFRALDMLVSDQRLHCVPMQNTSLVSHPMCLGDHRTIVLLFNYKLEFRLHSFSCSEVTYQWI